MTQIQVFSLQKKKTGIPSQIFRTGFNFIFFSPQRVPFYIAQVHMIKQINKFINPVILWLLKSRPGSGYVISKHSYKFQIMIFNAFFL